MKFLTKMFNKGQNKLEKIIRKEREKRCILNGGVRRETIYFSHNIKLGT
jgi:hypothetical protein